MATLMFQERFADKVADGTKRQTIRPKRKRPIKVGDRLSLRKWSGKAYRSKQIELKDRICIGVVPVRILKNGIMEGLSGCREFILYGEDSELDFARADGFDSFADMVTWFEQTHGLPFEGDLIRW